MVNGEMSWRHFDPVCGNGKQYQALIQATECHKASGRVWVGSRPSRMVNFGAQALSWKGYVGHKAPSYSR